MKKFNIIHSLSKLSAAVLAAVLFISSFISSPAAGDNNSKATSIRTNTVNEEYNEYALSVLPKHLHALKAAKELNSTNTCYLGKAFEIYNIKNQKATVYYPLVDAGKIIAILQVSKHNGEYNSALSKSFANNLELLLSQNNGEQYTLLTDTNSLYAYDGKTVKAIYSLNHAAPTYATRSANDYAINTTRALSLQDLKIATKNSERSTQMLLGPIEPYESKVLDVAGVKQQDATCWAATCAAIINYYKGTNLSDEDVARYIYGDNWKKGAFPKQSEQAYNHWGLYPSYIEGRLAFSGIKQNIDYGYPLDLHLYGPVLNHEVALIGYEEWNDEYGGDKVLVLLEPSYASHESVTLNSNGNFTYVLEGDEMSWIGTFEF